MERVKWQEAEKTRKYQYGTDPSGQDILYLRALQGHSGRNLIDPSLKDNVLIPNDFFEYIYDIGCAINLHSITNSGLIPGGQNLSKRQTVFFTSVDPMNEEHKDPNKIDLETPRPCIGNIRRSGRNIKTRCTGSTSDLLNVKGSNSIKQRCNAIILHETLPAHCISKVVVMGSGEIIYEKECASPRPPPKFSLKDNWKKEFGSEVAGGSEDSQQTQPKTKNPIARTERLVKSEQPSDSLTQEIDFGVSFGCESTNGKHGETCERLCAGDCLNV